jgi:hypothetical protein
MAMGSMLQDLISRDFCMLERNVRPRIGATHTGAARCTGNGEAVRRADDDADFVGCVGAPGGASGSWARAKEGDRSAKASATATAMCMGLIFMGEVCWGLKGTTASAEEQAPGILQPLVKTN